MVTSLDYIKLMMSFFADKKEKDLRRHSSKKRKVRKPFTCLVYQAYQLINSETMIYSVEHVIQVANDSVFQHMELMSVIPFYQHKQIGFYARMDSP